MAAKNGKAKLVGVIGDPIIQSLSPAIHEYWLKTYDINGAYVPLHVSIAQFAQALHLYVNTGFVGFNVTLPHKEAAFKMMQTVDDVSALCQATNTIIVQKNGALHGMNSDTYGFTKMVEEEQMKGAFALESALLLGAGGSARACVYALQQLGCKSLIIANRTPARVQALMEDMRVHLGEMEVQTVPLEEAAMAVRGVHCVVNTLSTGQNITIGWDALMTESVKNCMFMDVSYGRFGTEMTRAAEKHKRRNSDGLRMLLKQAVPGFEQWFGVTPKVDEGLIAHVRAISESGR
jgi:shikimate dehydrogenase